MINNSAEQHSKVQEQALHQELRIDPPIENIFVDLAPISFVRSGGHWTIDWIDTSPGHAVPLAAARTIVQNILSSSRAEVERFPTSPRAHTNLGLALLKEGLFSEAAAQFEAALNLNPNFYVALVNLAKTKIRLGHLEEAVTLYENARAERADDTTADLGIAYIAMRRGNYQYAVDLLDRTIKQRDDALPRFQMGIALLGLGNKNQALAQFRSAARLQVRSPSLHVSLGAAYIMLGDFPRATRSFRTALALSPRMLNAIHGLAIALLDRADVGSASRLLSDHLKHQPDDFKAHEILSRVFMSQCRFSEAYSHLSRAFETVKSVHPVARHIQCRITNNLGVCDCYLGHTNRAEDWYRKSIELADCLISDDVIPFHNLVKLYLDSSRVMQARNLLAICEERFPNNPNNELLSAMTLMNESRYDDACQVLETLVCRNDAPAEAYSILGYLFSDEQPQPDLRKALAVLEQGHTKYPADIPIINNLAYVLLLLDDTHRAEKLLTSIPPQKVAGDVFLTATSGLLCLARGEVEKGQDLYLQAEHLSREKGLHDLALIVHQKMHLELAKAYLRLNKTVNASKEVKAGLAIMKGRDAYRRQLEALDRSTMIN